MTRRKFTAKLKTKVVLELLQERSSLSKLAQKYEKIYLNPPTDGTDLYLKVAEYMNYYNYQRRHGAIKPTVRLLSRSSSLDIRFCSLASFSAYLTVNHLATC